MTESDRQLREYVGALPQRMLEEASALALGLVGETVDLECDRAELEHRLIGAACFVRKIVPGSPLGLKRPAEDRRTARQPPSAGTKRHAGGGRGPDEFEHALQQLTDMDTGLELDLIQCDPRRLDEWADLRSDLDAALLAAVLRDRVRVRRILLFDVPGAAERQTTLLHYRWTDSLAAAAGCFGSGRALAAGSHSPYRVRQLVLRFSERGTPPPRDRILLRSRGATGAGERAEFEAIWNSLGSDEDAAKRGFGLVELAGRGDSPEVV